MLETLYILYWRTENGFEGHGQPISYETCMSWIKSLNEKYPSMKHWSIPASG